MDKQRIDPVAPSTLVEGVPVDDAFAIAKQRTPLCLYVHGTSGMGKTALIRRFRMTEMLAPGFGPVTHALLPVGVA